MNLTNPMMMKGPLRDFVPVGPLTVRVRLQEGQKPRAVRLLVAGGAPRVEWAAGVLSVAVPAVRDHEVVAVDL